MGEKRASGQTILGDLAEYALAKAVHLPTNTNIVCLYCFLPDMLKYVQSNAFGYNKCKINSTREAALMIKCTVGEKKA